MSLRADLFEANSLSGTVRVLNGYANVELGIKPFALEGNISFIVDLRTGSTEGDILVTTPPITLVDLSEVVSFTANTTVMDEGGLITFTLTTQNAANNAVVYYSTRSLVSNVNALDFVGGNTGSITIVDNVGTVTLRANLDNSTIVETGEQFELEVRTGSPIGTVVANTTNSVTIADTSNAVAISAFSLSSNVTYEAGEIVFRIDTRNAVGNAAATYYYTVTGNADLYTASSGEIVVNDNTGYVNVITEASVSSNEIRDFTLQIRTGSVSGPIIYSTANVFVYDSTVAGLQATGGNISTTGGYKIHTFENTGTFQVTNYSSVENENLLEMLLVAGGGGGSGPAPSGFFVSPGAAGGGAGGLLYYGSEIDSNKAPNGLAINVKTFGANALNGLQIFVGAGGSAGSPSGGGGSQGANTYLAYANIAINGFRALRGGAGAGSYLGTRDGGSGGGGGVAGNPAPATAGGRTLAPEQGNYGGSASGVGPLGGYSAGGAGGGAGANGQSRIYGVDMLPGSNGGVGVYYTISGSGQYYAGGGGGASASAGQHGGMGGSGVGGRGANVIPPATIVPGTPGVFATGSGGGGYLGTGAPGIVIIRYPRLFDPKVSYVSSITTPASSHPINSDLTFTITGGLFANGDTLYYYTSGTSDQFNSANAGPITMNGNSATVVLNVATPSNVSLSVKRSNTSISTIATSNVIEFYQPPPYLIATGGNVIIEGDYKIHVFLTANTFNVVQLGADSNISYAVLAGGGGFSGTSGTPPSSPAGTGGGGGGLLQGNINLLSYGAGAYTVTVGSGGTTDTPAAAGVSSPGSNSRILNAPGSFNILAVGGGAGRHPINPVNTGYGGSGGGTSSPTATEHPQGYGVGIPGQGFPGGGPAPGTSGTGGGGGAGGAGGNGRNLGNPLYGVGGFGANIFAAPKAYGYYGGVWSPTAPGTPTTRWFGGGGSGAGGTAPSPLQAQLEYVPYSLYFAPAPSSPSAFGPIPSQRIGTGVGGGNGNGTSIEAAQPGIVFIKYKYQ